MRGLMLNGAGLLKHQQVIAASFLIVCQFACGPNVRPVSNPEPHLESCGVDNAAVLDRGQAECVARRGGLERGVLPWKVEEKVYSVTNELTWYVCNTLKIETESTASEGNCMYVRKADGAILEIRVWQELTVE